MIVTSIKFPTYTGLRCLMMPYVQGFSASVPSQYQPYADILNQVYIRKGDIGFLTIDESPVLANIPHRGKRAKHGRALHTEAGISHDLYCWGSPTPTWGSPEPHWGSSRPMWGGHRSVILDWDVQVMIANSLNDSCAIWNATHQDTTEDGDIGHVAHLYPYEDAVMMRAGEVHQIGILTPHESLPVKADCNRQFLRIVGSGVHGRESYFTINPLVVI